MLNSAVLRENKQNKQQYAWGIGMGFQHDAPEKSRKQMNIDENTICFSWCGQYS